MSAKDVHAPHGFFTASVLIPTLKQAPPPPPALRTYCDVYASNDARYLAQYWKGEVSQSFNAGAFFG